MKNIILFCLFGVALPFVQKAHPAYGVAIDKEGNLYFADIHHNERGTVWKLDASGTLTPLLLDFHAHNVWLDETGNLYTAHGEGDHTMVRLSKNGKLDTLFRAFNHKEFFGGNATFTSKGEIIFSIENYLWRLDEKGEREKLSAYQFGWNQAIYADAEGNYYGTDIGDGDGRLIKINAAGKSKTLATNLISRPEGEWDPHQDVLLGITKGPDGHLYVAETAGKRIVQILDNQETKDFYVSEGDWFPTGICFRNREAYIMEYKMDNGHGGPRIIKVESDGSKKLLFDYDQYQKIEPLPLPIERDSSRNWWPFLLGGLLLFIGIGWFSRRQRP